MNRLLPALLLLPTVALGQGVQEERAAVQGRLSQERVQLEVLRGQKISVLELLELSERTARAAQGRAKALDRELGILRKRLQLAEEQEEAAREELEEKLGQLSPRLWAMYRLRRKSQLDVLLGARDFAQLMWRSRAMATLVSRDLSLLEDARRALSFQRRSLRQADLFKRWVAVRLEEVRRETSAAEDRRAAFTDLLSYVKAEASQSSRVIKELERSERQLARLIEDMESDLPTTGFGALKGSLPLPAAGVVEVGFGKVVNPKFNTVTVQKGVDLRAVMGMPVRSVAPGKVVYSGWLRGYGNLMIVDHGGGFHTLMAHLAQLDRQVGESVEAGTVVGTVGDTGSLKGAYLYFEIRHRGLAVDPALWLAPSAPR